MHSMRYLLLFLLLTGCANLQKTLDAWRGKSRSHVVEIYGIPSKEITLSGKLVYQYDLTGDTSYNRYTASISTARCKMLFYFDSSDRVESVSAQGDDC